MTRPKVLISDALSPAAVQIFKDRGIDVDFQPNLGKDKEKLAEIIAITTASRSAPPPRPRQDHREGDPAEGDRPGRDRGRQCRDPGSHRKGIIVMNTPFGNSITTAEHAITLMLALAREIPQADASTQPASGEEPFMGVEITGKTLGVIGAATSARSWPTARWACG